MPYIRESNLSTAWARSFLAAMCRGVRGIAPLFVEVTGLSDGIPVEVDVIRHRLDQELDDRFRSSLPLGW